MIQKMNLKPFNIQHISTSQELKYRNLTSQIGTLFRLEKLKQKKKTKNQGNWGSSFKENLQV